MESSEPAPESPLLQRIRNTWEFSNLMQFIFIFGKAVKIDEDFSIEVGHPTMFIFVQPCSARASKLLARHPY